MKSKIIISLLVFSWILAGALVYLHKDRVKLIKLPPASLAQWYKPQSERHLWLHNMFKLRREMQAVGYYASHERAEPLALWVKLLNQHYQKIREMVPEWGGRLDQDMMGHLLKAQQANQFDKIDGILEGLQQSCDNCHAQFRAVTAALYRAPDFTKIQVNASEVLPETMQTLNAEINNIKIAIGAGDQQWALASLDDLSSGMDKMGAMCENCHQHSPQAYPGTDIRVALDNLRAKLTSGDEKQQGRALGELAVTACAQCHGTHRISYDTQQLIKASPGLINLLRH